MVTNIWVINSQGEILCTKRSSKNEGNPNKWQTYVGGHVKHSDSFEETALKELDEELGLSKNDGKLVKLGEKKEEPWKHITVMYAFFWNGKIEDIKMKDGEIEEIKWLSYDEYEYDRTTNPERWCNNIDLKLYKETINHIR